MGTQATGKTNFLHQVIIGLLLKKYPSQLKLLLIKTKGVEFHNYRLLEKHFLTKPAGQDLSIVKDSSDILRSLNALSMELDDRYELMQMVGVRNSDEYNTKFIDKKLDPAHGHQYLPAIVMMFDDLGALKYFDSNKVFHLLTKIVSQGYKTNQLTIFENFILTDIYNFLYPFCSLSRSFTKFKKIVSRITYINFKLIIITTFDPAYSTSSLGATGRVLTSDQGY